MASLIDIEKQNLNIVSHIEAIEQIVDLMVEQAREQAKGGYLDTPAMAKYLGKSTSWLKRKMADKTFLEGTHYHRNGGNIFHCKERYIEWVRSGSLTNKRGSQNGEHLHKQRETLHKSLFERAQDQKSIRARRYA